MSWRATERAAKLAAREAEGRADARAEALAARRERGYKAFAGACGNFGAGGVPLFAMKSNPGFQRCHSERGTTIRAGKGATLKLQRPNPAAGEAPMASPRLGPWDVLDRDTGEYQTAVEPPGMSLPRGAWHPDAHASVTTERGERVPVLSRKPYMTVTRKAGT
jgi:hypothetical protein